MAYLAPFGLLAIAVYTLMLGVRTWQQRSTLGGPVFALVMLMLAIWVGADAATLLGVGVETKMVWSQVGFTDVTWLAVGWYAFAQQYTGGSARDVLRKHWWLPGLAVVSSVLIWSNAFHHLVWSAASLREEFGITALELENQPTFWLIYIAGHALLVIATVQLALRQRRKNRSQPALVGLIIAAIFVPIVISALYHTGQLLFDPSPFAAAFASMACEWVMRRYHFLTLVPVARNRVFDSLDDAVVVIDAMGYVADVNPAACRLLNKTSRELVGSPGETLLGDRSNNVFARRDGPASTCDELVLEHAGVARYFDVRSSPVSGQAGDRIVVLRDVTEREEAVRQLEHQALYDSLTQLPNRVLLRNRLEQAMPHGRSTALLLLDLDRFKEVNDTLGHQAGDVLLQEVARRIRDALPRDATAARLGGDEFAILCEAAPCEDEALAIADRVISALRVPIAVAGREVTVGSSIGVALGTSATISAEDLLRQADLALYRAKGEGRGTCAVFEPGLERHALERLELEHDLRLASERDELCLVYQPIYTLDDRHICEVEALLRWNHPTHGLIAPDVFIPLAEETDLVAPIGQWVLEEACRQVRAWQSEFASPWLVMSVNLSGRQFQHAGLVADVDACLRRTGIDPTSLKLEITESVLMRDVDAAIATSRALKALGVQLAIDDFGTGYSSLGHLKRFPFDTLKIDRSFVDGLGRDERDTAIVRSVIALAKILNLSVTAEGVETDLQEAHLRTLGCERGQGFLFCRPQAPAAIRRLLARRDDFMSDFRAA
jgi:diguanylate cyclase (GGDEF)-like protein/PAS domain S-box-containing protein